LRLRICRFIYDYNAPKNKGMNWIIPYKPLSTLSNLNILINTKEFVGWNILFNRYYENETNLIIQEYIKEGDYVVEAGAQIGSETLLIANRVGKTGKTFAFEPNPLMMKRLQINTTLNDFKDRLALFEMALGEQDKDLSFYIKSEETSNQGMSSKYRFDNDLIEINVRQQTLDNWMATQKIPKLDFFKMDVQGAEMDILNGASHTMSTHRPLIFLEADDLILSDTPYSIADLFKKLIHLNYTVYSIQKNGRLRQSSLSNLQGGNWLAIPSEKNQPDLNKSVLGS
jgi:FkbM family methyltransferase